MSGSKCLKALQVVGQPVQQFVLKADGKVLVYGYYNRNHTYYDKVIPNTCKTVDNKKFECKSQFMRELHDDINSFEIIIYKQDGISQYTKDKEKAEQGGDN